ncbi:enolase C-terminal domain-like protein [Bacteriovorax sp. Seq25_V]|uniref:enolase C-terminal domain-like protein n=1 Tax=Bacteriovorax sp. Seq25_V TaxID=1201288 RepID=UPI00038A4D2F|nr:enolase C-terminal domain-like protein [Bacteriovorax sp. Seq25_V]EQC45549.1 hypothetical protein M900_1893 [Bacteriovorax sp. Seq25_V]
MKWEIDTLSAKLKTTWKIAGAEVKQKQIFLVKFTNGKYEGLGEVSYSSKEEISRASLEADLDTFSYAYKDANVSQFSDLTRLLDGLEFEVEQLRFAIEAAFLDYLSEATEISKWRILGTNTISSIQSMASIGLFSSTAEGEKLLAENAQSNILKVKISKETFNEQVDFINSCDKKIVLDANESWGSDLDSFVESIKKLDLTKILLVEQPFGRYNVQEHQKLKELGLIQVFLDESIADHKHLNAFLDICDGVVLKSAKSKSIPRILSQLTQARNLGLKTMLGCMVESSVGIASLFSVAYGFDYYDFDGFTKIEVDKYDRVFWDNGKVVLSGMN